MKSSLCYLAKWSLGYSLLSKWNIFIFVLALPELSACQNMVQDPLPKFFPQIWSFVNPVVFPRKPSDMCHLRSGFCPIFREIKTRRIKVIDCLIHQDNLILTLGLSHSTWCCTDAFLYWQYPDLCWLIRILNCLSCSLHPEVPLSHQLLAPYLVLVNAIPTTFVLTISSLATYPNLFWLLLSAPIASTATFHGLAILWDSRTNHHLHCVTLGKSLTLMIFCFICWPNIDPCLILFIEIFSNGLKIEVVETYKGNLCSHCEIRIL